MNCGAPIGKSDYCTSCGFHVEVQKKIWQLSNTYYNLGLDKAQIRDLSGAIDLLKRSLKFNKLNVQARNLLGLATENIMMDAVKAGGDRQELHERIRELSMEAGKTVKVEGKDNNLLELIAADPAFNLTLEELEKTMDPAKYTGRASVQVDAFLKNVINPMLEENKDLLGMTAEINV